MDLSVLLPSQSSLSSLARTWFHLSPNQAHLHLISSSSPQSFISTRALPRAVSFRHHWTHSFCSPHWLCSIVESTNPLCHPQRVVLLLLLIILPSSSTSPGFPAVVSIHDLLELKNTTGLICSSPVEVSSYPLLTCFLLFIWILSINITN